MYPGLLDDEQLAQAYNQFKVNPIAMDPLRMALYQAGQGIATGEGARLDQVLRGAAQGGVEGYNQGLQNQLLYEQAMQAMKAKEEEAKRKRETEEIERKYREALTRQADAQAASTNKAANRPEQELQKYREEVIALFPDPTNQTRQYLLAAGPTEGRKILAKYANQPALNETQRADLLNLINNSRVLSDDQKKALRGMANERGPEGQLSNNYNAVLGEIRQEEAKNAPDKPAAGPKLDDNNRILLAEGANEDDPQVQMAFNALYGLKGSKVETVYDAKTGAQTSKRVYPEIEEYVRNRFPKLAAARDQVAAQAEESTKRPSQQVLEAQALIGEMNQIEDEIQKVGADIPMATGDYLQNQVVGSIPLAGKYFQSDTFRRNEGLQNEWIVLVLRQESGAAIGQDEYDNYRSIYFPIAGDSEAVMNAKRRARARAQQERAMIASGEAPPKKPEDFANGHANMFGLTPIQVEQPTVQDPSVEGLKLREEDSQYD